MIEALPKASDVTPVNQAIWTEDGTISLHFGSNTGKSSLYEQRRHSGATEVPSMDFGAWLKRSFAPTDYVIVSLDIEGAEYPVLEKMLDDGSVAHVDRVYVEVHPDIVGASGYRTGSLYVGLLWAGVLAGLDSVEHIVERGSWSDQL